jgi:proline iminopeptidase
LEELPEFDYPTNLEVNDKVNASWKLYIQKPDLHSSLSRLDVPTLFVYGEDDIRPRWPVEQLAALMPQAKFQLIPHAPHYIWFTHSTELKASLEKFIHELGA